MFSNFSNPNFQNQENNFSVQHQFYPMYYPQNNLQYRPPYDINTCIMPDLC